MGHNYRFSIIPAGAVTDARLKAHDVRVIGLLGRHTDNNGWCRRSQVRMAVELACSRGTIQASLDRLVAAGWVEKRLEGRGSVGPNPDKQPFSSHSYRVILDRDDVAMGETLADARKNANENGGASRLAPPSENEEMAPGASPEIAGGASPGVAPLEQSPVKEPSGNPERERTRARVSEEDSCDRFLKRYPTGAVDDVTRTRAAWDVLTDTERDTALASIETLIAEMKRHKRSAYPAAWKYLEERRWELLPKPAATPGHAIGDAEQRELKPATSPEARARAAIALIAGATRPFVNTQGSVMVLKEMPACVLAFAPLLLNFNDLLNRSGWHFVEDGSQQCGAWRRFLCDHTGIWPKAKPKSADDQTLGLEVPWPWPPKVDGTIFDGADAAIEQQKAG